MTRFKLGNTENYIEVSIVYKVKEDIEKQEIFIVTPDLLKSYELPASKFISFLQQNLTFEDLGLGEFRLLSKQEIKILKE